MKKLLIGILAFLTTLNFEDIKDDIFVIDDKED